MNESETSKHEWVTIPYLGLGIFAIVLISIVHASIHWQWSALMDDVNYRIYMPNVGNLLQQFLKEISSYWHEGRFYPFKYLINLLKWRVLPLVPSAFHWFDFLSLLVAISLGAMAVLKHQKKEDFSKRRLG